MWHRLARVQVHGRPAPSPPFAYSQQSDAVHHVWSHYRGVYTGSRSLLIRYLERARFTYISSTATYTTMGGQTSSTPIHDTPILGFKTRPRVQSAQEWGNPSNFWVECRPPRHRARYSTDNLAQTHPVSLTSHVRRISPPTLPSQSSDPTSSIFLSMEIAP